MSDRFLFPMIFGLEWINILAWSDPARKNQVKNQCEGDEKELNAAVADSHGGG